MENGRGTYPRQSLGLGPRPAHVSRVDQPLSPSRRRLLEALQAQPEAATLAALVVSTGLHANTVREHLEALERRGLVARSRARPAGRGRPAWLYQATAGVEGGQSEYAGLATALASAIQRSSDNPTEDAVTAGEDWGRELAEQHSAEQHSAEQHSAEQHSAEQHSAEQHSQPDRRGPAAARRRVVSLLDSVGFASQPGRRHTDVRLTRCPLLEAAHKFPDVVCAVHLGLVRGALQAHGVDARGVTLRPFAEPGACLLRLGPNEDVQ